MDDFIERRTEGFSQGQRVKVAIARAMVHRPQTVMLDEPSNGLDVMKHLNETLGRQLPAIFITADRSQKLEEEIRQHGYGLLRKPIRPAALRALITNTLKNL